MKLVSVLFAFVLGIIASAFKAVEANYKKAAALVVVGAPMLSHAQPTATDIAVVVAAIGGSVALIVLIGNAKLLVKVAIRTFAWLASSIR